VEIIDGTKWLTVVVSIGISQGKWYKENGESAGWNSPISDISR
jgi:hypothetical protein